MKINHILPTITFSLFIFSCNSQSNQNPKDSNVDNEPAFTDVILVDGEEYKKFETEAPIKTSESPNSLTINYYDIKDTNNGLTVTSVPLPGKWQQQTSGEYQFVGPNGMKIYGIRSGDFSYTNDPQKLEMFRTVGNRIAAPKTMDQIVKEDFLPNAAPYNRKLINTYPIPEAAAFLKKFDDMQYKIDLTPKKFEAIGTEWEDPDGTSYLTIIIRHEEQGSDADSWGYAYDFIEAPKTNFEQAKRTLINYTVNQEINLDWIRKVNADLKNKIDSSNIAHQKMMAEVKRNMDVFQEGQAQRRADREILDNRISNYILGKSEVVNPQTGTTAKVTAGNTYYWINEKGEYISTESYSWDPNQHEPYKKYNTWTRYQLKN